MQSYEEKYEKLIRSVMYEFDCGREEACEYIENSGMYSMIEESEETN